MLDAQGLVERAVDRVARVEDDCAVHLVVHGLLRAPSRRIGERLAAGEGLADGAEVGDAGGGLGQIGRAWRARELLERVGQRDRAILETHAQPELEQRFLLAQDAERVDGRRLGASHHRRDERVEVVRERRGRAALRLEVRADRREHRLPLFDLLAGQLAERCARGGIIVVLDLDELVLARLLDEARARRPRVRALVLELLLKVLDGRVRRPPAELRAVILTLLAHAAPTVPAREERAPLQHLYDVKLVRVDRPVDHRLVELGVVVEVDRSAHAAGHTVHARRAPALRRAARLGLVAGG